MNGGWLKCGEPLSKLVGTQLLRCPSQLGAQIVREAHSRPSGASA